MRPTIERLRIVLVAGAVLLLGVVAIFLGVARYRAHRFLKDLPAKLGVDIQKETNAYSYSQAVEGRTVFTIHAARAVQRVNGKVTLHDVGIVLYGRDQKRADRIYGEEFEYDQQQGVVRAAGEVHLDLQAIAASDAASRAAYAAGKSAGEHTADDPNMIHARTSGLLYEQKSGILKTDAPVEFTVRGISGRARGAEYDTAKSSMVLQHEVRLSGVRSDRPMLLTAEHAEFNRGTHVMQFEEAHYVTVGEARGGRDARQESRARRVQVTTSAEGKPEHAEASGGVTLADSSGSMDAPAGSLRWSKSGKPEQARLTGGVAFRSDTALARSSGKAATSEAVFDAKGRIAAAQFAGKVSAVSLTRANAKAAWSTSRSLTADQVDVALGETPGSTHRTLQHAVATGTARVELNDGIDTRVPDQTVFAAQRLTAQFGGSGRKPQLLSLDGAGQAMTERRRRDGSEERSTADTCLVKFSSGQGIGPAASKQVTQSGKLKATARIVEAVERGGISIHQLGAEHNGERESLEAHAEEVRFDGDDQLQLLGDARVLQGQRTLRANRIVADRSSGRLSAQGSVEASYAQRGSADLVHVAAERGEFFREQGEATFHGGGPEQAPGQRVVRAWQGGTQIEAPSLTVRQQPGELTAFGPPGTTDAVRTVLASGAGGTRGPARQKSEKMGFQGPLRVSSGRLQYSAARGEAEFREGVLLRNGDATVRSSEAVAFLHRGVPKQGNEVSAPEKHTRVPGTGDHTADLFPSGGLDRVVAKGGVQLQQTGREGRGDTLVYTVATDEYLLTGSPSSVTDVASGTVQGDAIRFFAGDRSVTVTGDPARGAQGRVHSELKVKSNDR